MPPAIRKDLVLLFALAIFVAGTPLDLGVRAAAQNAPANCVEPARPSLASSSGPRGIPNFGHFGEDG